MVATRARSYSLPDISTPPQIGDPDVICSATSEIVLNSKIATRASNPKSIKFAKSATHKKSSVKSAARSTVTQKSATMTETTPDFAKLPFMPFSKKEPNCWFRQVEAVFQLMKVEDLSLIHI